MFPRAVTNCEEYGISSENRCVSVAATEVSEAPWKHVRVDDTISAYEYQKIVGIVAFDSALTDTAPTEAQHGVDHLRGRIGIEDDELVPFLRYDRAKIDCGAGRSGHRQPERPLECATSATGFGSLRPHDDKQ